MQCDINATKTLQQMGYTVMRFWEHEIKPNLTLSINKILLYI